MFAFFRIIYYYFGLNLSEHLALWRKYVKDTKSPEDWLIFFTKLNQFAALNPTGAYKFLTALYNLIIVFEIGYWFVWGLYFTQAANDGDFGFQMSTYVILLNLPAKILLGVFVLLFFLRKWIITLSLPKYVTSFIIPLLVILREEIKAGSFIELSANLGKRTRKSNFQQTKYNYKTSAIYLATWFLPFLWLLSIPLSIYYVIAYEISFLGMDSESLTSFGFVFQIIFFMFLLFVVESFSPPYPRIITKIYRNELLSFKVKLADKSVVNCQIIESLYEIIRKKKNPRGKVKTKKKHKSVENCLLKVRFPSNKYTPTGKVDVPVNTEELQISNLSTAYYPIKEKKKRKNRAQYPPPPDLKQFLDIVGSAYRRIKKTST